MPLIDEILDELASAQCFTRLDFKSMFHQVRMSPIDERKTAFKTKRIHLALGGSLKCPSHLCQVEETISLEGSKK
jgi:hypothetical protein